MDASVVALAQTCSEAMVKRPAKAHLFFLNMGCPSIEIETDRGREHHCWCPPAQIRTSPIRASGSYLGCLTAKRSLGQG